MNSQKKHKFHVSDEDFENIDLNGGQAPRFQAIVTNDGSVSINSVSIELNALPWTVSWSSNFPLLSGATDKAQSTSIPLGAILSVGTFYQVTFTATFTDGTTDTVSTNAIYTLNAGLGL